MNFPDAVKSGFQNAFKFSGRATRPEYWYFTLLYVLCSLAGDGLVVAAERLPAGALRTVLLLCNLAVLLILLVPQLAVATRRLHDTGHSGWWVGAMVIASVIAQFLSGPAFLQSTVHIITGVVFSVISLALILIVLFWLVKRGDAGDNRFGPPPATASETIAPPV